MTLSDEVLQVGLDELKYEVHSEAPVHLDMGLLVSVDTEQLHDVGVLVKLAKCLDLSDQVVRQVGRPVPVEQNGSNQS